MLHCMECVGESRAPVGTWHRFLHNKGTSKILNTLRELGGDGYSTNPLKYCAVLSLRTQQVKVDGQNKK